MLLDSQEEISTVHDALLRASEKNGFRKAARDTSTTSFKLLSDLKLACFDICRANGTTFGAFLRECCESLVNDYGHNRTKAQAEANQVTGQASVGQPAVPAGEAC